MENYGYANPYNLDYNLNARNRYRPVKWQVIAYSYIVRCKWFLAHVAVRSAVIFLPNIVFAKREIRREYVSRNYRLYQISEFFREPCYIALITAKTIAPQWAIVRAVYVVSDTTLWWWYVADSRFPSHLFQCTLQVNDERNVFLPTVVVETQPLIVLAQ